MTTTTADTATTTAKAFQVGAVVRISRGDKRTGRATITTDNGDNVDLLWEDAAPAPGIIMPKLPRASSSDNDDEEVTVMKSELQQLHSFETEPLDKTNNDVSVWKERGDTLLRLGDASAAVQYYERALQLTSKVQIGSTVLLVSKDGTVKAAEVDCLEDDTTADITYVESGEEAVLKVKAIRLAISLRESDVQVRVLLNLARCLLQLAEFDNSQLSRPSLYRHGAVVACSLAYALLSQEYEDDDDSATNFRITILLLRSKAHAGRARWQPAVQDVDQLLQINSQSREGRRWKKELQKQISQQEKANKKLVKGMCQWIQKATNEGEEGAPVSDDECSATQTPAETTTSTDSWTSNWVPAMMVLFVAIWMYQKI